MSCFTVWHTISGTQEGIPNPAIEHCFAMTRGTGQMMMTMFHLICQRWLTLQLPVPSFLAWQKHPGNMRSI